MTQQLLQRQAMNDDGDDNQPYQVGRGRPPQHTQFAKGKSGNPKGRPKGSKNFATTIQSELKRHVSVTEEGRRKKITKREATAKQLVNRAASGDTKSIQLLLNETRNYELEANTAGRAVQTEEDDRVMENIIRRIREVKHAAPAEEPGANVSVPPQTPVP